jgi:hypothetical protein
LHGRQRIGNVFLSVALISAFAPKNGHGGKAKKFGDQWVVGVIAMIMNLGNSGGEEQLSTVDAGIMGDVGVGTADGNPSSGRIGNCILFRMDRGQLMAIPQTGLVGQAWQKTVIPGCHNAIVNGQDTAHMKPLAKGPGSKQQGNAHKVFLPGRPFTKWR